MEVPLDESNLVYIGFAAVFRTAKIPTPMCKFMLTNNIPAARGLGSSSAAIVGGIIAGLILAGSCTVSTIDSMNLFHAAIQIENHPDNISSAIFGGIRLSLLDHCVWKTISIPVVPKFLCVIFIPHQVGKTAVARGVLSAQVSRQDAVYNISRVAWLVNALHTQQYEELRTACSDALHQQQRSDVMYPHLFPVINSALAAGAVAAFLSGAGPAVMAWTQTSSESHCLNCAVASAMTVAALQCGVAGCVRVCAVSQQGAHVTAIS